MTKLLLAEEVGVSNDSIRRWESGEREPRASDIQKLCTVLGVTEAELLNGPQKNEWEIRVILEETDDWEVERMDLTNGSKNRFSVHIGPGKIGVEVSGRFDGPEDLDDVFSRARKCAEETLVAQGKLARI